LVVVGLVLELAEHAARVLVGHVVVVVGMDHCLVRMLMLGVVHDALHDGTLLHTETSLSLLPASHPAPPRPIKPRALGLRDPFGSITGTGRHGAVIRVLPQSTPRAVRDDRSLR